MSGRGRTGPGIAALVLLGAGPVAADGVGALCAARGASAPVCACAARGLAGEIGRDEYALYQRVGFDAGRLMARGTAPDVAWDEALAAETARASRPEAVSRRRAEAVRRAHDAHIDWCGERLGG